MKPEQTGEQREAESLVAHQADCADRRRRAHARTQRRGSREPGAGADRGGLRSCRHGRADQALEDEVRRGKLKTEADLKRALRERLSAMLAGPENPGSHSASRPRPDRRAHRGGERHREDHHRGQARGPASARGPDGVCWRRPTPTAPAPSLSFRSGPTVWAYRVSPARPAAILPRWPSTLSTLPFLVASIPSSSIPRAGSTPRKG